MNRAIEELRDVRGSLGEFLGRTEVTAAKEVLERLVKCAEDAGTAWSGSWLGYQSRVYYRDLQPPPPGAHFSIEWGGVGPHSRNPGEWVEYDYDAVRRAVFSGAGLENLDEANALADQAQSTFEELREVVLSVLHTTSGRGADPYLEKLREEAESLGVVSAAKYVRAMQPSGSMMSRDSLAVTQGVQTPPHLAVVAEVAHVRSAFDACDGLSKLALRAASHMERVAREDHRNKRIGTNVFIGHGRSPAWRDLKDFVQDRLRLPWDEFNRVPVAGVTNIARLSEMLDDAAIALIVMTAEDERLDGSVTARMNVIHEAGLFQGRLGFTRAIVLLEEGCEEFSNIHGLGQIRFPSGRIAACFEEVRQVLEREGLLDT